MGGMSRTKAIACVLASGALWGCISLFVRQLDAAGMSAMDTASVRMLAGAIGMLAVVLVVDRGLLRIRLRDLWMFFGTGVVSVMMFNVCYFTCMLESEASIAVVLLYTSPIFVMLMSALFFKERVTWRKVVAIAMTFIGCVLVSGLLGGVVRLTPFALAAGIASGFFYATYSIFGRVALKQYNPLTITFYTFVMGTIAGFFLGDMSNIASVVAARPIELLWIVGLGVFCTIAPYILYTLGLKHLEPGLAAVFATVEPLVGSMLGVFAYGESVGVQKVVGMLLILAAVTLVSLGGSDQENGG